MKDIAEVVAFLSSIGQGHLTTNVNKFSAEEQQKFIDQVRALQFINYEGDKTKVKENIDFLIFIIFRSTDQSKLTQVV